MNVCNSDEYLQEQQKQQTSRSPTKAFLIWRPLRPRQQQLTDCSRRMRERERKKPKREHESNTSLKTFIENRQFLPIPAKYIHTYTYVRMYTKLLSSFHEIYRLIKALCFDLILNLKCVNVVCAVSGSE